MPDLFHNTVSALCYDLARIHDADALPANDITRFVLAQHGRMAWFLAVPLRWATLAFSFAALLRGRTGHHRLSVEVRRRRCDAWRLSSFGPCRDLLRFYESLVVIALYSRDQP